MTTTPSTTRCEPGAVVLVRFVYPDESGEKLRPAVVLSVAAYHAARADAVIVALSGTTDVSYFGDCEIVDWAAAGLRRATKAKGVVRTIEQSMIERRIGTLTPGDLHRVRNAIRGVLGL